jgi:hypothetical protein
VGAEGAGNLLLSPVIPLSQYEDSGPRTSSSCASIGAGHELFSKFWKTKKIQQQYISIKYLNTHTKLNAI